MKRKFILFGSILLIGLSACGNPNPPAGQSKEENSTQQVSEGQMKSETNQQETSETETSNKQEANTDASEMEVSESDASESETRTAGEYMTISAEEAKQIMDDETDYIIVDVREQSEYDEGHIPNAVLLPLDQIAAEAENTLTDKDQTILVYCRSGRRSKLAAEQLAEIGYTNVKDFGGIMDWPYEVE